MPTCIVLALKMLELMFAFYILDHIKFLYYKSFFYSMCVGHTQYPFSFALGGRAIHYNGKTVAIAHCIG